MKILLKFWNKDSIEPIMRYGINPKVLGQKLALVIWQKAFLRVLYGKKENVFGKIVEFKNEGYYYNKKDLQQAFRAFCEK